METLFRKVLVTERLPVKGDRYFTNDGIRVYSPHTNQFLFTNQAIEYWLEPVELPSEDMLPIDVMLHNNTMYHDDALQKACNNGIKMCYNYILGFINNKK